MPKRLISLLPSITEIICALDAQDQIVGRSHECDYPPSVSSLPICTESYINTNASSREIDEQVKKSLIDALSIYKVDRTQLETLRPDVVLTQSQCEVCAVHLSNVEKALADWLPNQPQLVSLAPNRLSDIWDDIRHVGKVLDLQAKAETVIEQLQARLEAIRTQVKSVEGKPTVACIEWIEPLMAAGNWMPELVEIAGGVNIFGKSGEHSPWLDWKTLVEANPEVIVGLPCGFDLERTEQEMAVWCERQEWQQLKAVQQNRVFLTDGHQYFNRPGPRLVESAEILAEIIHPDLFQFGHEGFGWKRWSVNSSC